MNGDQVLELRKALGLSTAEFRALMGVNAATLTRWEVKGERDVFADPRSARLLEALHQVMQRVGAERLGAEIRGALKDRGGLGAVYVVLGHLFGPVVRTQ